MSTFEVQVQMTFDEVLLKYKKGQTKKTHKHFADLIFFLLNFLPVI